MKKFVPLLLMFVAASFSAQVLAEGPSVSITAPANGARLDSKAQNKISYEVVPGPRGGHVHLYVDGQETAILRQLKGSHALDTLAPGKREICIKLVNQAHTPTGVQQCITVTVE